MFAPATQAVALGSTMCRMRWRSKIEDSTLLSIWWKLVAALSPAAPHVRHASSALGDHSSKSWS